MTRLRVKESELHYEGALSRPIFGLFDAPGSTPDENQPRAGLVGDAVLRRREQEWLVPHGEQYRGWWVALEAEQLAGHGKRAQEALDAARRPGILHPLLV
jgi:hypothetical protein